MSGKIMGPDQGPAFPSRVNETFQLVFTWTGLQHRLRSPPWSGAQPNLSGVIVRRSGATCDCKLIFTFSDSSQVTLSRTCNRIF